MFSGIKISKDDASSEEKDKFRKMTIDNLLKKIPISRGICAVLITEDGRSSIISDAIGEDLILIYLTIEQQLMPLLEKEFKDGGLNINNFRNAWKEMEKNNEQ